MDERAAITNMLRGNRVKSMDDGKELLVELIAISTLRTPTVNDYLKAINAQTLTYGDNWGWPNLHWDILSAKYGVKAYYDIKNKKSYFSLQLPPVEKLIDIFKFKEE